MKMCELDCFHVEPMSAGQDACIPMLARCFDEFVDFQKRFGNRMPFVEESFVARSKNGDIAGHVGIMPMQVHDSCGGVLKMAGVASVAVHPDYRRRGIAAGLCNMAAEWAEQQGFAVLSLYTGLNPVYRSCGWADYSMQSVSLENPAVAEAEGKSGEALTEAEKKFIIRCYENSPVFAGKVVRSYDRFFHSWERMFRESFFRWHLSSGGYALEYAGNVAEAAGPEDPVVLCRNIRKAFLSPEDPVVPALVSGGWRICSENDSTPACWSGENVMLRICASGAEIPGLFFPLSDKF